VAKKENEEGKAQENEKIEQEIIIERFKYNFNILHLYLSSPILDLCSTQYPKNYCYPIFIVLDRILLSIVGNLIDQA